MKRGAVARYYITADYKMACARQLREMVNSMGSSVLRPDLQRGRIYRDEQDVNNLIDMFLTTWKNPFEEYELSNIATGAVATQDISTDLLSACNIGKATYSQFVQQRLLENRTTSFFDRLPKLNLKTFTSMNKKIVSCKGKEIELKVDGNLFAKMAVIAQSRKLDMKEVMRYELGPFPWSLATCDGMLRKTNKAVLSKKLEKLASPVEKIESNSACNCKLQACKLAS